MSGLTDRLRSVAGRRPAEEAALQNRMLWRGQPGHYEVWYLTLTDRSSRSGFWIRYTMEAPTSGHGQPYAQLWFCRGDGNDAKNTFAINRRFPIASLSHIQSPFEVRIGDSVVRHDGMSGSLSGDGHRVSWELSWEPAPRSHLCMPKGIYGSSVAETLFLSPNLSINVHGHIDVDGRRFELHGEPGGQSHVWGRKHGYNWAWGHCNSFHSEDPTGGIVTPTEPTVLETLSARLRRGPLILPLTLFAVYPDGLDGEAVRFTEWSAIPFSRSDYRTGHYALSGEGPTTKAEATFSCHPDDMVRAEYVDPDGAPAYCHFAATASCRLTLWRRTLPGAKWRPWRQLWSDRGAQFEWGGRAGDSLVKKRHRLVVEN